ncbi:lipid II:glycine glycyltransferase FemX [Carboxylicivirga sp. RSCT41]|uniref:lipid II:glycine glycyltransferase FemX n=1 Tax=Carboxylicivirga agarovorans TaxID=3417570 RepID=UPI003D346BFF
MFRVLKAKDPEDYQYWLKIWNEWEDREIFAHPNYLQLYDHVSDAACALYKSDESLIIFPFCLRKIEQNIITHDIFDIITPYGYGDIYQIGDDLDESIKLRFQHEYSDWVKKNNVVSEFIRFNLMSNSLRSYIGDLIECNSNIICDLTIGVEGLWNQFKPKVRRNIRKATRVNLKLEIDHDGKRLKDFFHLYNLTMDRLQAKSKYYFPLTYFEKLQNSLNGQCAYFYIMHNDKAIASVLVLFASKKMYYFLGGSDSEYFDLRPNELLHFEVMQWGIKKGIERYVLGGGYSNNDSIFSFKKSFFPNGVYTFYCGQHIHDTKVYDELVIKHENDIKSNALPVEHSAFFPRYRSGERGIVI